MKEIDALQKWCPHSLIAVQKKDRQGSVEMVGFAYNRTILADFPQHDALLSKACMCIGSECACWKSSWWNVLCYVPFIGYFWQRRGRCKK